MTTSEHDLNSVSAAASAHERETVGVFTFAVYPADLEAFEPILLDVPTLSGEDVAARRAWWTAFHLLGPRGFEPEDFYVCRWHAETDAPGRLVGSRGFLS